MIQMHIFTYCTFKKEKSEYPLLQQIKLKISLALGNIRKKQSGCSLEHAGIPIGPPFNY